MSARTRFLHTDEFHNETKRRMDILVNNGWMVRSVAVRSDDYRFFLVSAKGTNNTPYRRALTRYRIEAGCRHEKSFKWWRNHIKHYRNPQKRAETRMILDLFEKQIKCRWV